MNENWCTEVEQGAVLLTVNQRLSRFYVKLFSDHQLRVGRQWWETPEIMPLSTWLKKIHTNCVANGSSNATLLADIVSERLWQHAVASDSASSVLLDIDLAANHAQKAWRVAHAWQLLAAKDVLTGKQPHAGQNQSSEDQRAFLRWCSAYFKQCKNNNWLDSATLTDHVMELISLAAGSTASPAAMNSSIKLPDKILLAGFLTVPKQMQALFDLLQNNGVALEFIEPAHTTSIIRMVHTDDNASIDSVASLARNMLAEQPDQHIGIVVHDLQQRRAQVLRAFDKAFFPSLNPNEINAIGRPYDLSIGLPLNEQSVVRTALLFLGLLVKGVSDTELSALLLSPYLPGSDKDLREREKVDRDCRSRRVRQVSFFEFIKLLPKGDVLRKPLQMVAKQKWPKQAGAAQWAEHFGKAVRDLGWPGKSIDSEEYQAVEAWNSCLDDFQLLDDGELFNSKRAIRLLTKLCRSRVFQLETATTPIQIMGRLESHGISFDKLLITGLDAEQWPPVATPTSFISIKAQQDAGVPDASPSLRLELAEKEMALWKHSAHNLYVCHASMRDGHELQPAPIIADVAVVDSALLSIDQGNADQDVAGQDVAGQVEPAALIQASAVLESQVDTHGPQLQPGSAVKGGARLLENQARCPFKAFALHRLGIKKLEEAGIGLDPRQHGTLFHHAIEFFWEQVRTQVKLLSLSEAELDEIFASVIEQAMKKESVPAGLQNLQGRYLHRLLTDWIAVERLRQPFEVVELEQELDIGIAGIFINVKVDRMDRLESGQTVVIDYKTGQNNKIKSWSEERIENPQLPLYAGTNPSVEGACFAQVFPNQHKFIGTTSEDNIVASIKSPQNNLSLKKTLHSWEDARDHWAQSLGMLATEVREGVATITPVNKACDYCELPSLCRINKSTQESEDADVGADGDLV